MRLTFPSGRVAAFLPPSGRLLIRASGGGARWVQVAFRTAGSSAAFLSDLPGRSGAAAFTLASLLATRPRELELLVVDDGAIALGGLRALRIAVEFPIADPLLFRDVVDGCALDAQRGMN